MINRDIITVVINDANSCYNKVIHVHCKNEKTVFNFCDFSKLEEMKNIQIPVLIIQNHHKIVIFQFGLKSVVELFLSL